MPTVRTVHTPRQERKGRTATRSGAEPSPAPELRRVSEKEMEVRARARRWREGKSDPTHFTKDAKSTLFPQKSKLGDYKARCRAQARRAPLLGAAQGGNHRKDTGDLHRGAQSHRA